MGQGTETVSTSGTRDHILDVAATLTARHGVRALRVQQVAKGAGVSVPLLYYHFDNRAALVRAVLHRGMSTRPSSRITKADADGLRSVVHGLLAMLADDPGVRVAGVLRSEALAAAVFDDTLRDGVRHSTDEWCDETADLVRAAVEDGSVDPAIDADRAARQLVALVDGLRERWLAQVVDLDTARATVERAATLLLAPGR